MRKLIVSLLFLASIVGCKKETIFSNNPGADELHNKAVGASANELLASNKYAALKIEVQYMPGFEPDAAALSHLQTFLNNALNKPSGITIVTKQIPASSSTVLSANDVKTIENTNRTAFTQNNEIAVYVLYTNGTYTEDNVLGIAYRNTSVALFGKKIRDNSGGIGQTSRTKLEATVLEHELGHLLGLVDLGTPMQANHKDAAHGNHCTATSCLMYYASETTDILGFLLTGAIPSLDAQCVSDLRANGGK